MCLCCLFHWELKENTRLISTDHLVCMVYVSTQLTERCVTLLKINWRWWDLPNVPVCVYVIVLEAHCSNSCPWWQQLVISLQKHNLRETFFFFIFPFLCVSCTYDGLATHGSKNWNFKHKVQLIFDRVQHAPLGIIFSGPQEWSYHTLCEISITGQSQDCVRCCVMCI